MLSTVGVVLFTCRTTLLEVELPNVSVTVTVTVKVPATVGVHWRFEVLDEVHPNGRPAKLNP